MDGGTGRCGVDRIEEPQGADGAVRADIGVGGVEEGLRRAGGAEGARGRDDGVHVPEEEDGGCGEEAEEGTEGGGREASSTSGGTGRWLLSDAVMSSGGECWL